MERGDGRVKCARRWTALDVSVGIISDIIELYSARDEEQYLLVTDDWYALAGRDCPDKAEQNKFEVR